MGCPHAARANSGTKKRATSPASSPANGKRARALSAQKGRKGKVWFLANGKQVGAKWVMRLLVGFVKAVDADACARAAFPEGVREWEAKGTKSAQFRDGGASEDVALAARLFTSLQSPEYAAQNPTKRVSEPGLVMAGNEGCVKTLVVDVATMKQYTAAAKLCLSWATANGVDVQKHASYVAMLKDDPWGSDKKYELKMEMTRLLRDGEAFAIAVHGDTFFFREMLYAYLKEGQNEDVAIGHGTDLVYGKNEDKKVWVFDLEFEEEIRKDLSITGLVIPETGVYDYGADEEEDGAEDGEGAKGEDGNEEAS